MERLIVVNRQNRVSYNGDSEDRKTVDSWYLFGSKVFGSETRVFTSNDGCFVLPDAECEANLISGTAFRVC